jgi:hypothetical protein
MFHSFYATTKDRKGNEHNYRLPAGTAVPSGHEITNLSVASRFKFSEIVDAETAQLLRDMFPVRGRHGTTR